MSWRLARSLTQLQTDLDARFPSRVRPDWTIGDAAHAGRGSDHNPNPAGVVCAIDVRGVPTARALWDHIMASRDRRVKYVIFQGRIVSSTVSPWSVRRYGGANPHNDHIHVSVGRGPDGNSGRPDLYDSTASWGVGGAPSSHGGFLMSLTPAQERQVVDQLQECRNVLAGFNDRVAMMTAVTVQEGLPGWLMQPGVKMALSDWFGKALESDNPTVRKPLEDLVRRVIREEQATG